MFNFSTFSKFSLFHYYIVSSVLFPSYLGLHFCYVLFVLFFFLFSFNSDIHVLFIFVVIPYLFQLFISLFSVYISNLCLCFIKGVSYLTFIFMEKYLAIFINYMTTFFCWIRFFCHLNFFFFSFLYLYINSELVVFEFY